MIYLLIIIICYLTVAAIRTTKLSNEWLPLISGCLGLVFSLITYLACPTMVPDISIPDTLIYGFISGLAATGSNQVLKQSLQFFKDKYGISISLPTVNKKDKE